MKRLLIGAVLVAALILPSAASALSRDFTGHVDPVGTISFTYKTTDNGRKVVDLAFSGIRMHCNDGTHKTSGKTKSGYAFEVKHKRFGATLSTGEGAFLKVHGTFRRHYHRAHGEIRVFGDNVTVDSGGRADGCDTGTDDWHAHA